jgi:hypothetical protein
MLYPIEIKTNIAGKVDEAIDRLGAPGSAVKRQIWFAEDGRGLAGGELRLLANGVIVRIRSGDGPDDTTAKLRPCDTSQLQDGWTEKFDRPGLQYRVEGDWSGAQHSLAASAVSVFGQGTQSQFAGTPLGDQSLTSGQLDFLAQCAKVPVCLSQLVALGPIASTKWSDVRVGDIEADVERWTVADLDFLELSIRLKPKGEDTEHALQERALRHQSRLLKTIGELGLQLATTADNKTRRVLTAMAATIHH